MSGFGDARLNNDIPDAWGGRAVTALYVHETPPDDDNPPRRCVCLELAGEAEAVMTPDAAEELIRRLKLAISEARNDETPLLAHRHALGARAYNCLGQAHVRTVEAAARLTDAELLSLHNFGVGCLERVRSVVGRAEPA